MLAEITFTIEYPPLMHLGVFGRADRTVE